MLFNPHEKYILQKKKKKPTHTHKVLNSNWPLTDPSLHVCQGRHSSNRKLQQKQGETLRDFNLQLIWPVVPPYPSPPKSLSFNSSRTTECNPKAGLLYIHTKAVYFPGYNPEMNFSVKHLEPKHSISSVKRWHTEQKFMFTKITTILLTTVKHALIYVFLPLTWPHSMPTYRHQTSAYRHCRFYQKSLPFSVKIFQV